MGSCCSSVKCNPNVQGSEANNIRYRLQPILPLVAFVRWITPVGRFPHAATPEGNFKFRCSVRKLASLYCSPQSMAMKKVCDPGSHVATSWLPRGYLVATSWLPLPRYGFTQDVAPPDRLHPLQLVPRSGRRSECAQRPLPSRDAERGPSVSRRRDPRAESSAWPW